MRVLKFGSRIEGSLVLPKVAQLIDRTAKRSNDRKRLGCLTPFKVSLDAAETHDPHLAVPVPEGWPKQEVAVPGHLPISRRIADRDHWRVATRHDHQHRLAHRGGLDHLPGGGGRR